MARIAGRNGRLYVGLASGTAAAEPIQFMDKWTITFSVGTIDVTAMGDTNLVKVAGLPDVGGDFSGYYDDATVQTYTAASDGVARRFYLYPSTSNTGQYWYGTGTFDFNVDADVKGAVAVKGKWEATSSVAKVG